MNSPEFEKQTENIDFTFQRAYHKSIQSVYQCQWEPANKQNLLKQRRVLGFLNISTQVINLLTCDLLASTIYAHSNVGTVNTQRRRTSFVVDNCKEIHGVTHIPRASSTSPRLGSRPRTLPLHVSGISSSAGYAWSFKDLKTRFLKRHKQRFAVQLKKRNMHNKSAKASLTI